MIRTTAIACLAAGITAAALPALAAQQVYKFVDEKGNVVYSQTPPANKDADKIKLAPTSRASPGRGRDYEGEVMRRQQSEDRRREAERLREEQRLQKEEQERGRRAALEAECNRNRGTDCANPETLRRMEADQLPRSGLGRR